MRDEPSPPRPLDPGTVTLAEVIRRRWSRRDLLRGASAGLAVMAFGRTSAPSAHAGEGSGISRAAVIPGPRALAVDHQVAAGYRAQVVVRWGDPVLAGAPPFDPRAQSGASQARQFGYNADFVAFVPLPRGSASSDHGLLCVNHEYTDPRTMFHHDDAAAWGDAEVVAIEQAAVGHSVVEIARRGDAWVVVTGSPYARRIDARTTTLRLSGPAAGHPRLATSADPTGTRVLGTLHNCSGGVTPWGTVLSGEENVDGYFSGVLGDAVERRNHQRMGVPGRKAVRWAAADPRFDVGVEPHEPNRFGWVVEIDPFDATSVPVKRTALGRMKHEAATTVVAPDGRAVVFLGDDEAFEHVYRFVSARAVDRDDPAKNRDLLDEGVLYAARFDADGTGRWLPLVHGQGGLVEANGFRSQADVLIEAREAATRVGATPMDRPEDVEANPATGRVYVVLTKNKARPAARVDAANPRAENLYGHILELIPTPVDGRPDPTADAFTWNVFLRAGDPARPADGAAYGPGMAADQWLANPDNIAFDPRGRLWIATDGADDFDVPDGVYVCDTDGPARAAPRMLYAAPTRAEVCGPCFTPDGTTLFVAVQHPGEGSPFAFPSTRWPDFRRDMPPRPSVVAIRREDGGPVGG